MSEKVETVDKIIKNKETIYGITTGFGLFSDVLIEKKNITIYKSI